MVHHGLHDLIRTRPSIDKVAEKDHHILSRQRELFKQGLEREMEPMNIAHDPNTMSLIKGILKPMFKRSVPKRCFVIHTKENAFDCI